MSLSSKITSRPTIDMNEITHHYVTSWKILHDKVQVVGILQKVETFLTVIAV